MKEISKTSKRALSRAEFAGLASVPPEVEWFKNIASVQTARAYKLDVGEFTRYLGIQDAEEMRLVTRSHVIAWRDDLKARKLSGTTIRRKLSAISSLFDYLCNANAITHNPVKGVSRPKKTTNKGSTPAISSEQARDLLSAPNARTLKGKRDKAILATLLYHGLRRDELCRLRVGDIQMDEGVLFFIVHGKGDAIRKLPVNPKTIRLIDAYLKKAGHGEDLDGPLFRPVDQSRKISINKHINTNSIYRHVIRKYGEETGINGDVNGFCVHSLRATAATNALSHDADIAKVQEWLGHKDISTTRIYDRRDIAPEDSPTFKVKY